MTLLVTIAFLLAVTGSFLMLVIALFFSGGAGGFCKAEEPLDENPD